MKLSVIGRKIPSWKRMRAKVKPRAVLVKRRSATANGKAYSRCKAGERQDIGLGYKFRSSWEANYARYLNHQQAAGIIKSWEYEPERFRFTAIKRGTTSYLPDFKVIRLDGSCEYHEVKGWFDKTSKLKLTRMAKYYPQIKVILIDTAAYKSLTALYNTLPYWES